MRRCDWKVGDRIVMLENYWFDNAGRTGMVVEIGQSILDESLYPIVKIDDSKEKPLPMADGVMRLLNLN